MLTSNKAGSKDTEAKELAVKPNGVPSSLQVVTTVTPVINDPKASRSSRILFTLSISLIVIFLHQCLEQLKYWFLTTSTLHYLLCLAQSNSPYVFHFQLLQLCHVVRGSPFPLPFQQLNWDHGFLSKLKQDMKFLTNHRHKHHHHKQKLNKRSSILINRRFPTTT